MLDPTESQNNFQRVPDPRPLVGDFRGNLSSTNLNNGVGLNAPVAPPPLPPRSYNNNLMAPYNNSNFGYSPFSSNNSLFNNNPYNYYGGNNYLFGQNYGGMFGRSYDYQESDFVRLAEQNSRNAFQSVESVVFAFNSVSQMLESTLNAFYSSFRAVLGVADQFSRLKVHFQNIFATLALVRFVRWLWHRLLVLLRLRSAEFAERAWSNAAAADLRTAAEMLPGAKPPTNWPLIAFFAVAIGGPLLIYKLMAKIMSSVEDSRKWATGQQEHYTSVALYDFNAGSQHEISFSAGQSIRLAPKNQQPQIKGWLLGSVDGVQVGLVPANYIRILGRSNGTPTADQLSKEETKRSWNPPTSLPSVASSASLLQQTYDTKFNVNNFDDQYEKSF